MTELTKREQLAVQLAGDHWGYVRQVIQHDGVRDTDIERIGFHFQEAFKHGWKHADKEGK